MGNPRAWSVLAVLLLAGCDAGPPRTAADGGSGARLDAATRLDGAAALDGFTGLDTPGADVGAPDAGAPDAGMPDAGPPCPSLDPLDCSHGPGSGEGAECYAATSCFLRTVQDAINGVVRDHPEWFDASAGPTHVLEVQLYMDEVVAVLNTRELCAYRDPYAGDEIVVKHDNAYAENFDILTATEDVRSGGGIYTSTCAPAWL